MNPETVARPELLGNAALLTPKGTLRRAAVAFLALNFASAVLFIIFVNRPVYDDGFNIYDVHQYAQNGVSRATLQAQRNAPGPTSFIWMAAAVRLLDGNELRAARIGAFVSWVLLGAGVLWAAHFSRTPELWFAAVLTLLVFPHAVEAACTVLTEGPALMFASLGALGWVVFVERGEAKVSSLFCAMGAGLFLGLSVTCRQYNLALLPAAGLVAAAQFRSSTPQCPDVGRFAAGAVASLLVSALPVLGLVLVWKGIANPSIESGAAYNGMYKAGAGFNLFRPVVALFCVSFYLLWLTFPLMFRVPPKRRWSLLIISLLPGIAAGYWQEALLQPGPLKTVVNIAGRVLHGPAIPVALIAAVSAYNLVALLLRLWDQKSQILQSPMVLFSVLAVLFFIGEQFVVGGNIPFYDRYVLQIAPFIGVIAFAVLPSLSRLRLAALVIMSFFSHVVVWRNAFGH